MDALKLEVKEIIADIIEIEPDELDDKAHFLEDLEVDSLLALEILSKLEKKYQIEISEDELIKFTNVEQVVEVVRDRVGSKYSA